MEFLGQGSDPSHGCDLSWCNAGFLTHCARPGMEPASQRSQDTPILLCHVGNSCKSKNNFFFWLHLWLMEVPGPEIEPELQLRPTPQLWQCQIHYATARTLFFFLAFRAAPAAYGGSQARGPSGAVATGLHHSHSHAGSELRLRPTPQLMATPDP